MPKKSLSRCEGPTAKWAGAAIASSLPPASGDLKRTLLPPLFAFPDVEGAGASETALAERAWEATADEAEEEAPFFLGVTGVDEDDALEANEEAFAFRVAAFDAPAEVSPSRPTAISGRGMAELFHGPT